MLKLLLMLVMGLNVLNSFPQESNIALSTIVTPSSDGCYYPQLDHYIQNRLKQLTLNNHGISSIENDQFAIALTYDVLDKQILAGSPNKVIYNLNVSLFVLDLKGQKIYSSFNTSLKGVGNNEMKALINCFKGINLNNSSIREFISRGEKKIIEYYDRNFNKIISKAQVASAMKDFDAAIHMLLCIPECCKGYKFALKELSIVYKQFVDQHCNENLAQARAAWYASPNSDGASVAGVFLSEIYPDAACYSEALSLFNEIKKQMGNEWKFTMKQYDDAISLERQKMAMMREIAIAYVKNQPKETTNVFWK